MNATSEGGTCARLGAVPALHTKHGREGRPGSGCRGVRTGRYQGRRSMRLCCPPNRGCNSPQHDQPCVLELCREARDEEPEAALAVSRWDHLRAALTGGCGNQEARFRRGAYERARTDALRALLMRAVAPAASLREQRAARRRSSFAIERRPTTRLDVLMRQYAARRLSELPPARR
jgi:hypothetical protein